jgi:rod shape-determining protein MreC
MRIRNTSLFRRYHIAFFVIVLLFSGLILMSMRVKQRQGIGFVDAFLLEIASPFQKATTSVTQGIRGVFRHYLFVVHTEKENDLLKKKIAQLQEESHQMKEMAIANERYRKLLQFRETEVAPMIAAEVIGRDPSSWFRSVTINKGEVEGVVKGMAVISPDGAVGQVLKTSLHYATVLLITDYNSAIDAIVQRTRSKTIVEGKEENRCELKYLLRTEDVVEGDVVVTSGQGGKFPKGLRVGDIQIVEKKGYGVFQRAELVPSVDFTKLEEVLIIKESSLPGWLSPPTREEKVKRVRKVPGGVPKKK